MAGELDRLRPPFLGLDYDPRDPRATFAPSYMSRLMTTLTGLRTFEIDMDRQRRIAMGQKKRIIRELTIARNRALKRGDRASARDLRQQILDQKRRRPEMVLPLSLTGLPTEP